MFNSIKLKLIVWFLVIFSVVFAGLELYLYHELEDVVIGLVDDHLKMSNQSLANLLTIEEGHGQLETELVELSMTATGAYKEPLSGHYYQISSADGKVLTTSPSLGLPGKSLPFRDVGTEPIFETITGPNNEELRLISRGAEYEMGKLVIQSADTLEETYRLVGSFRTIVLIIFPAVFALFASLGLFLITGWALRPLKKFSGDISQITEANLNERIEEEGVAAELRPLATSFNSMLETIEGAFLRQKQFLSDASHELRTPTSIIKSFCDVTLGRERKAEYYKEAIGKIGETVNRMCDIINRILVISRIDAKTIQFKPVRVDLKDSIKDVLKLMETAASNKNVRVTLEGANPSIKGDREGLTEVFTNIVENAIKYNREGGQVDISISTDGEMAVVCVRDTGIGIPAEEQQRVFDRFYRVDASRGQTVGSGLGLSIVKSIIEAHSGRIELESEPGSGTTFRVYLPVKA